MCESRIHNVEIGKAKDKFPYCDSGQKPSLADHPVIRGSLKFKESVYLILINGKPGKNTLVSVRVAGWDESMSVVLEKAWNLREHLGAAPPGIEQLSHSQHGRQAATDHVPE